MDNKSHESSSLASRIKRIEERKRHFRIRYYSLLGALLIFTIILTILTGCQKEFDNVTPSSGDKSIPANSAIAQQIQRIALNDGSADNIIDRISCTELVLPVTVIANDQEVNINTSDDLELVERIFDEDANDEDTLIILFPVTVILPDHTETTVNNQNDLDELSEECNRGRDDDIECLDFKYPLTFSTYDPVNQVADVVTINDDKELFQFFDALDDSQFAGFKFPVTVILANGEEVTIGNNNELRDALNNYSEECDEDDDNDFDDNDVDDSEFVVVLIEGEWKITTFFDSSDKIEAFEDFVFTFNADGTVSATDGVTSTIGVWESYGGDGTLELQLNFEDQAPFTDISRDWQMVNFSSKVIRLRNRDVQHDSVSRLVFEKV